MSKLILITVSLLLISSILTYTVNESDDSDADVLPTMDVYQADTGARLKGAILDDAYVDVSTRSSSSGAVLYILDEGSTLISGKSYLMASGDGNNRFRLIGSLVDNPSKPVNQFIAETGLRISFYTNPECTGTPTFYSDMMKGQTYAITDSMELNVSYYIKVQIFNKGTFTERPDIKNVGFTFTLDSGSKVNAVYFNDGQGNIIDQKLMTNGDPFVLPADPVREGYTFTGWFTDRDERISAGDTVSLVRDTTLYAHWWKGGTGTVVINTPSGDRVEITSGPDKDKGVVIDIHAVDDKGETILDVEDLDAGHKTLPLDFNGGTGDNCYLDQKRANDIIEVYDAVVDYLTDHDCDATAVVDMTPGNNARADPVALGKLGQKQFSLIITNEYLTLNMDNDTINGLSSFQDDINICIYPAKDVSLTSEQRKVISGNYAYSIIIESGGVHLTQLQGVLTVEIPYEEPSGNYFLKAYCVDEYGNKEDMKARYSSGIATFRTTHLSIYYLDIHVQRDPVVVYSVMALFAAVIVAAAFASYVGIAVREKEVA